MNSPVLWFWCACLVIGHALYANTPFVNLEFAFCEAARGLANPGYAAGFERYWQCQCNPLGYSAFAAGLLKFLHLPDAFWVHRLPSLLGGVGMLVSGWVICCEMGRPALRMFPLWAAVTTLNPLIWVYGGRATADVLPAGLACLAFATCFAAKGRTLPHLLAGCLFSLAILVKFNVILLGLGFVYLIFAPSRKEPSCNEPGDLSGNHRSTVRRQWKALACYTVLPGFVLAGYLAWTYREFGVLGIAEGPAQTLNPFGFFSQFPAILVVYLAYFVVLLGLPALIAPARLFQDMPRRTAVAASALAVGMACVCGWALMRFNAGEMDYGGFDHLLPKMPFVALRIGCLALAALLVIDVLRNAVWKREQFAMFLVAVFLPYLAISSFFRPVQRYLLVCLPFVLLYLLVSKPAAPALERLTRRLGWSSAAISALISFVAVMYQIGQGQAAENMARWIADHGQLAETDPGAIWAHAAQHFPVEDPPSRPWLVQTHPGASCRHTEPVRVFGRVLQTYYLCSRNVAVTLRVTNGVRAVHSDDIKPNSAEWRPVPHAKREDTIAKSPPR